MLSLEIPVDVRVAPSGDGRWSATSSRWLGRAIVADSPQEAEEQLRDAMETWLMHGVALMLRAEPALVEAG